MTAHVARKGEPDDKSNITKSNQSTNPNQNFMKQDVKKFGNIFSTIDSSNDSNNENRTFKLLWNYLLETQIATSWDEPCLYRLEIVCYVVDKNEYGIVYLRNK